MFDGLVGGGEERQSTGVDGFGVLPLGRARAADRLARGRRSARRGVVAAAMRLGLNGLRCGELCACNVEDVGAHSWHHTLRLTTTKGDRPTVVALAPPTMPAVAAAIDSRDRGPLLVNRTAGG